MQHNVVTFSDHPLELNELAGVLAGHPLEIVYEPLLAASDMRIVLDVLGADIAVDRFRGATLVEHEVIECSDVLLVALEVRHSRLPVFA